MAPRIAGEERKPVSQSKNLAPQVELPKPPDRENRDIHLSDFPPAIIASRN
jgi:hypothetical protein